MREELTSLDSPFPYLPLIFLLPPCLILPDPPTRREVHYTNLSLTGGVGVASGISGSAPWWFMALWLARALVVVVLVVLASSEVVHHGDAVVVAPFFPFGLVRRVEFGSQPPGSYPGPEVARHYALGESLVHRRGSLLVMLHVASSKSTSFHWHVVGGWGSGAWRLLARPDLLSSVGAVRLGSGR